MSIGTRQATGVSLSSLGLAFITIAVVVFIGILATAGSISTDYLVSLGQIAAFGMALLAIGLAISSDTKMDINSNENFLRVADRFEDNRIDLTEDNSKRDYSHLIRYCWKSVTYMERALKLHKMVNIESDNQSKLYNQVIQLVLMSGFPWGLRRRHQGHLIFIMREKDVKNVLTVCEKCLFLDLTDEQRQHLWHSISYIEHHRSLYT